MRIDWTRPADNLVLAQVWPENEEQVQFWRNGELEATRARHGSPYVGHLFLDAFIGDTFAAVLIPRPAEQSQYEVIE